MVFIGAVSKPQISSQALSHIPMVRLTREILRSGLECATCLEPFARGERVARLNCHHIFHRGCIVPWLQRQNTCPMCRRRVDPNSSSGSDEDTDAADVVARAESASDHHYQPSSVSGLRAVYDPATGTIRLEWDSSGGGGRREPSYSIEYRVIGVDGANGEWRPARPMAQAGPDGGDTRSARLDLATAIRDGDEIVVRMRRGAEWSQPLTIAIEKRSSQDEYVGAEGEEIVVDEGDLVPPLNFTANVLGPTTVRLDWRPAENTGGGDGPLHYILAVKQLSGAAVSQPPQEIQVEDTSFMLGSLHAGQSYEITVKTASSRPERISSAAAIVEISMPRADEFFEVGNLIITSRFKSDGSGVVNLTWEVPPTMQRRISAYDVQYTRSDRPDNWRQIHFPHSSPTAMLYDLQADSEYLLKIKTLLEGNLQTESGEFRFRTPRVEVNPVSKLDVIYSSDTSAVRLQWILGPHVPLNNVAGYDVYLSENESRPEREWRHVGVVGSDPQVAVDGLHPQRTYFARVSVRNRDGTVLRSPSIYRFTTIDQLPPQQQHYRHQTPPAGTRGLSTRSVAARPSGPAHPNVDRGTALIEWTPFPEAVDGREATGARVYYTEQSAPLPLERWQLVRAGDAGQRSLLLVGLRPSTVYNVRVVPVLANEELATEAAQSFQITSGDW